MSDQPEKAVAKAAETEADSFVGFDMSGMDTVAASNAGAEIEIRHPTTHRLTGVFIGVLGKDSQIFQDIVTERRNEALKAAALQQKTGRDPEIKTAEELEQRGLELLIACTTHFRTELRNAKGERQGEKPAILCNGEWLSFNVPNAEKLYRTYPALRKQVDEAIGDLSVFMKP